jgi:hypothetical protein
MQIYHLIIIESILQDIEISYITYDEIFKPNNDLTQEMCSNQYEPCDDYEIDIKYKFLEDFINNGLYEKLIEYNNKFTCFSIIL